MRTLHTNPPPQDHAFAPLIYQSPVDHLITSFKFGARLGTGRVLGHLFARDLHQHAVPPPDSILPVPLHRRRLLERGYNQALELARPVSRQTGIPLDTSSARRTRRTHHQSRLHASERGRNMRGAFRIHGDLAGRHIAVLDDIVTTGHTTRELVRSLKRAGAGRVSVWAMARVPQ